MPQYGVNLVAQHSRWSNEIQKITGKATFEVCALGVCKEKIVEFSALDVVEWATKIASWASSLGKDYSVPLLNGLTVVGDAYTPEFTGPMTQEPILYVAPDPLPVSSDYTYVPTEPMDTL